MENKSYIKLFRKLLESPIFENEIALKVWIWCLLKATHKEREQLVGHQLVYLKKGQFVFGRKKAAEELKMTESMVYRYMKLLEELQMLNIKSNNKFSIVTIEKWEDYQIEELKTTSNYTTNEQQMNTNKNVKNIYLYLYKEYSEKIQGKTFSEVIRIIGELKKTEEYLSLNENEQDDLYNKLMSI